MPWFVRVPFLHVKAITLWFVVLWKYTYEDGQRIGLTESIARHETIHFRQYNETFVVGFLVLYLWYWLKAYINIVRAKGFKGAFWDAYYLIPFEQEAYAYQEYTSYLEARKKNAWHDFITLTVGTEAEDK